MEKFIDICKKVNSSEPSEVFDIINGWKLDELNNKEYDKVIEDCYKYNKDIDKEKMPFVLEALYKSDLRIKTALFGIILENNFEDIPFVTNLENIALSLEKYKFILPTLVKISAFSYNGIADCMNLIMLNNDPEGEYLVASERNLLIDSMEKKFELLLRFISENEIDSEIDSTVEILADMAVYINNKKVLDLLEKFIDLNISDFSKTFVIKALLYNNRDVSDECLEKIASNKSIASRFFNILESINREQYFPKKYRNQEYIACSNMINWLLYPTELGEEPDSIEFVDILEEDNIIYYIYKFTAKNGPLQDKGYMIGVSGGYDSNIVTSRDNGRTFSNFDTISDDYFSQAKDIIDMISRHWSTKAGEDI